MNLSHTKFYKMFGIVLVVFLLGFSIYEAVKTGVNTSEPNKNPANNLTIPTTSGTVKIMDVTKNPVSKSEDTLVIAKTDNYDIVYFPKEQTFLITIESPSVNQARISAEQDLLKILNVGIADACRLKVVLSVPFDVNQDLSGKNYGLSFCPSGISF